MKEKSKEHQHIFYLELSRNFGHQNALKAGIDLVRNDVDAIISMDGDMQHPPKIIPKLIQKWEEGFDIVYDVGMRLASGNKLKQTFKNGTSYRLESKFDYTKDLFKTTSNTKRLPT